MKQPLKRRFRSALDRSLGGTPVLMLIIVVSAMLLGGGARADLASLLILRPLSIIFFALALLWYWPEAWSRQRGVIGYGLAILTLAVLHVLPMPPALWTLLPSRDFAVETYRLLGTSLPWSPLSLSAAAAWNALFSLALPAAALIVAATMNTTAQRRLAILFAAFAVLSGALSLLQIASSGRGPLYFYRITNFGAAVGLFANRNHNGLLMACAFPILACFWSPALRPTQLRLFRGVLLAGGLMLLPMIMMTGSRSALLMTLVGLIGAVWIAARLPRPEDARATRRGMPTVNPVRTGIILAISGAAIILVGSVLVKSPAFSRLLETDRDQEVRIQALPQIWHQAIGFLPFGSGAGSFEYAYREVEPISLISPQYLNHAHNDWLEVFLDYGVAGALLAMFAVLAYARWVIASGRRWRTPFDQTTALGWAGGTILAMLAAMSAADYPLRVPSIATLAVVAVIWMQRGASRSS